MYYLTFIYLCGLVLVQDKLKEKNKFILAVIPLVFIIIFRYGVGADYFSYERVYLALDPNRVISSLSQFPKIEVLYKLLNIIALKLGLSYHVFVTIISTALTILTLKWIKDNSPNFYLSVLLHFSMLFIYWSLSALRQGIVLTLLLYIYFNGKKEYSIKVKILSVVILFFMHASAIIVPIIYLLSLVSWDKFKFLILLLLAPLSRLLFRVEFLMFFSKLPYVDKAISYLKYDSIQYLSVPSLLRFSFFVLILWHYDELLKKYPDKNKRIMLNFTLLSLLMYFYLPVSMVIGTRVTIFGYYMTIIIFPMILSLYNKQKLYPIVLTGFLSLSLVSFYNEFSKLADRSGYNKSMHQLNFETILNKDRNRYNDMYALHLKIDEDNQHWAEESYLAKRVNDLYYTKEVDYSDDMKYLSVYFKGNEKYGVINTMGEIVKAPTQRRSVPIYGDVWEMDIGKSSFGSKTYRRLGDLSGQHLTYSYVEEDILAHLDKENIFGSSRLVMEELDVSWLDDVEFLKNYNIEPVVIIEKYSYPDLNDYAYIKLKTNYASYYIILKNEEVLVEKIYRSVRPISVKDVIVASTNFTTEYINAEGEIIWFE